MPGYVYRGTQFDVPTEPRKRRQGVFDPTACGSRRGYKQHQRFREDACQKCLDACAERMAEWRRNNPKPVVKREFNPDKCGTPAGYSQHRHYKVPLCDDCRQENISRCREQREKRKEVRGNEDKRH